MENVLSQPGKPTKLASILLAGTLSAPIPPDVSLTTEQVAAQTEQVMAQPAKPQRAHRAFQAPHSGFKRSRGAEITMEDGDTTHEIQAARKRSRVQVPSALFSYQLDRDSREIRRVNSLKASAEITRMQRESDRPVEAKQVEAPPVRRTVVAQPKPQQKPKPKGLFARAKRWFSSLRG